MTRALKKLAHLYVGLKRKDESNKFDILQKEAHPLGRRHLRFSFFIITISKSAQRENWSTLDKPANIKETIF